MAAQESLPTRNVLKSALNAQLGEVMSGDVHKLRRRLNEVLRQFDAGKPFATKLQKLEADVERSASLVKAREACVPKITFPESLPIAARQADIAEAIEKHQVLVLAGETGSGKTTQLPKICLSLGRGVKGLIGHTQPRRIAARTVASRIAEELNTELGESVGYQVRFTDHSNDKTHIKLMTDGILLAEIQNDPYLNRYDTLIIDEAHERSLNIDFLLGYLKTLLPKRPDLKLIITSATIDLERFSQHFDGAPIVEVSGRTFPVDVHYRPMSEGQEDLYDAIVDAVNEIDQLERAASKIGGDILVFLSGEREIRETALALRKANLPHFDVLPLYARLGLAEQNQVFQAHRGRRIILATNVAETSITVPGIRYVIDPGTARISRYSYRTKVQRLPIEAISQASANQRKGRCGRVSDGICFRLYDEDDFNTRPEFTDAEILRTNLGAVILQMLQLKIGDIRNFPFVDGPDSRLINDGYKLLEELQAVDKRGLLSPLGRQLTRLPLDPRLGRIVLAAKEQGCLREVLIIVSAMSVQDPRERPADKRQAADEKHKRFVDEQSDFLAWVNLWNYVEEQRQDLSQNKFRKECKREFLSWLRLREWRDIHRQLRLAIKSLDLKENAEAASYESLHRALMSGLLDYLGFKGDDKEYLGSRNRKFHLFPGSSQFKKAPKWVLVGQLLETTKLYGHSVAKIDPVWALSAAEHLLKRHHSEPHYSPRTGQVMAWEKVTLYGLVLVEKQRVSFANIDPATCREVFIRAALVEGAYKPKGKQLPAFYRHNLALIEELHALEAKSRRRDIMADEQALYTFYSDRLPEGITKLADFEHWRKESEREQEKLLFMTREHLMQHDARAITEAQFPNELEWQGMVLPLEYHFEPGHVDDGVSILVPVSILHQMPSARLEWLVPGMLREKCIALVKGLPKQWRKNFVPVPEYVDKALAGMKPDNTPLVEALAFQLKRHTAINMPPDIWASVVLDDYYKINIQVLDEGGRRIDAARELDTLRARYRDQVQKSLQSAGSDLERSGIVAWDFGELAETAQLERGGISMRAYPALVDEGDSVALRLIDNPAEALFLSRRGVARLAYIYLEKNGKYLRKEILKGKDIGLSVAGIGNREKVVEDLILAAIAQLCELEGTLPRSQEEFEARANKAKLDLVAQAQTLEQLLLEALAKMVAVKQALKKNKNAFALAFTVGDINQQLSELIYPGFLFSTPLQWLQQYPRYFKAIEVRLEKAPLQVQKDKVQLAEISPHLERLKELVARDGELAWNNEALVQYRWLLEEFRVSLFAQSVKTLMPVSGKRLNKQWALSQEN